MATDVNLLLEQSRCLDCLSLGQLSYIEGSLIDGWAFNESDFTPASIPEFVSGSFRWYDAGSFVLADGAAIAVSNSWVDKSPNHSNATTTAGNEPTFRTNIFGTRPAVRFNGIEHMVMDSGFVTLENFTILAVVMVYGDSIWMSRSGINRQVRAYREGVNNLSSYGGSELQSGILSTPFSSAKMIGYRRTSGAPSMDFFENGNVVSGGSGGDVDFNLSLSQIGAIDGAPLNIDIGELAIYDSVMSTEDVQALYSDYFKPKFGLP